MRPSETYKGKLIATLNLEHKETLISCLIDSIEITTQKLVNAEQSYEEQKDSAVVRRKGAASRKVRAAKSKLQNLKNAYSELMATIQEPEVQEIDLEVSTEALYALKSAGGDINSDCKDMSVSFKSRSPQSLESVHMCTGNVRLNFTPKYK